MKDVLLILLAMLGWFSLFFGFSFVLFWLFPLSTPNEIKLHTKEKGLHTLEEKKLRTLKEKKPREVLYNPANVTDTGASEQSNRVA